MSHSTQHPKPSPPDQNPFQNESSAQYLNILPTRVYTFLESIPRYYPDRCLPNLAYTDVFQRPTSCAEYLKRNPGANRVRMVNASFSPSKRSRTHEVSPARRDRRVPAISSRTKGYSRFYSAGKYRYMRALDVITHIRFLRSLSM